MPKEGRACMTMTFPLLNNITYEVSRVKSFISRSHAFDMTTTQAFIDLLAWHRSKKETSLYTALMEEMNLWTKKNICNQDSLDQCACRSMPIKILAMIRNTSQSAMISIDRHWAMIQGVLHNLCRSIQIFTTLLTAGRLIPVQMQCLLLCTMGIFLWWKGWLPFIRWWKRLQ